MSWVGVVVAARVQPASSALQKFLLESPEYTNLEAQLRLARNLRRRLANELRNLKKSARKLVKKHYINYLNNKAETLILSDEAILKEVGEELKPEKAQRVDDNPEELDQVIQQVEKGESAQKASRRMM